MGKSARQRERTSKMTKASVAVRIPKRKMSVVALLTTHRRTWNVPIPVQVGVETCAAMKEKRRRQRFGVQTQQTGTRAIYADYIRGLSRRDEWWVTEKGCTLAIHQRGIDCG